MKVLLTVRPQFPTLLDQLGPMTEGFVVGSATVPRWSSSTSTQAKEETPAS